MTQQTVYRVYPAVVTPILLSCAAIGLAVFVNLWLLAALPFIFLGSVCSAPNLNLADGCLALVSVILGLIIAEWFIEPLGLAILTGSFTAWLVGAIEKRIRMEPVSDDELEQTSEEFNVTT
jgi:hypothetical protein